MRTWFSTTLLPNTSNEQLGSDAADLRTLHRSSGAILIIALKRTGTPHTQGMVALDAHGRVERFVEKSTTWDYSDLANAGIYLCEPDVLRFIPSGVATLGMTSFRHCCHLVKASRDVKHKAISSISALLRRTSKHSIIGLNALD
jgi:NDP-sugar pyrophosphorylase family protein